MLDVKKTVEAGGGRTLSCPAEGSRLTQITPPGLFPLSPAAGVPGTPADLRRAGHLPRQLEAHRPGGHPVGFQSVG